MKKRTILLICILAAAVAAAAILPGKLGRRPYKSLKAEDIASAAVSVFPYEESAEISDLQTLTALLNDLVIYEKFDSDQVFYGDPAVFTVTKTNGTEFTVVPGSPFATVDGVRHRSADEPCEKLDQFGYSVLDSAAQ